jgi:hypothetical protein
MGFVLRPASRSVEGSNPPAASIGEITPKSLQASLFGRIKFIEACDRVKGRLRLRRGLLAAQSQQQLRVSSLFPRNYLEVWHDEQQQQTKQRRYQNRDKEPHGVVTSAMAGSDTDDECEDDPDKEYFHLLAPVVKAGIALRAAARIGSQRRRVSP